MGTDVALNRSTDARGRRLVAVLVVTVALIAGCGSEPSTEVRTGSPGEEAGRANAPPERPAPFGLHRTVSLPEEEAAVTALFKRLPPFVAGLPRRSSAEPGGTNRHVAVYGPADAPGSTVVIQAVDVTASGFYPNGWTAGDVVAAAFDERSSGGVAGAGRDGPLVWMRERIRETRSAADSEDVEAIRWGTASSRWLYGARASSAEALEAAVAAFLEASRGS